MTETLKKISSEKKKKLSSEVLCFQRATPVTPVRNECLELKAGKQIPNKLIMTLFVWHE